MRRSTVMGFGLVPVWSAILAGCSDGRMVGPPPPPPPPPTTVTVAYCAPFVPVWVAFQDGDGQWTRGQPVVANGRTTFTSPVSAARGGVAAVTQFGAAITSLQVFYGTRDELTTASINTPRTCVSAAKSLSGTVAGLDTNDGAIVEASVNSLATPLENGPFTLAGVDSGPVDVLALRFTRTNAIVALSRIILRRGLDAPDGASLPVLDFHSPEAFAPATAQVTLDGIGSDIAFVATRIQATRLESVLASSPGAVAGPVRSYLAVPEARLLPGDLQVLSASTNSGVGSARSAAIYFRTPQDLTLSLGPDLLPPTFSMLAPDPTLRIRAQFVEQSAYDRMASITYQQNGRTAGSATRLVTLLMTAAYRPSAVGGYDILIPDLSGVDGFNLEWALSGGSFLSWTANRVGGTVGLGTDPVATEGAVQRTATIVGELRP